MKIEHRNLDHLYKFPLFGPVSLRDTGLCFLNSSTSIDIFETQAFEVVQFFRN